MKNDSKLSKNSLYFYSLFFSTFVINKYRRFFGRSEKFFYPNYTSIEYLGMGSNLTRFKNKFEKGEKRKKERKKKMEKESKKRPEVNYLSGVYRVRYWNKCSTRRWIGVLWMGCSCILDHNCPVSLRVYASRIPPCITMQRVSRVDKRNPVYRFVHVPPPPFFLEREGKKRDNYG